MSIRELEALGFVDPGSEPSPERRVLREVEAWFDPDKEIYKLLAGFWVDGLARLVLIQLDELKDAAVVVMTIQDFYQSCQLQDDGLLVTQQMWCLHEMGIQHFFDQLVEEWEIAARYGSEVQVDVGRTLTDDHSNALVTFVAIVDPKKCPIV